MLDAKKIKSHALVALVSKGSARFIKPNWLPRIRRIVSLLEAAENLHELNVPGLRFHQLTGDRKGTYSLRVDGNWRITFKWHAEGPYDVDLEDYHG